MPTTLGMDLIAVLYVALPYTQVPSAAVIKLLHCGPRTHPQGRGTLGLRGDHSGDYLVRSGGQCPFPTAGNRAGRAADTG